MSTFYTETAYLAKGLASFGEYLAPISQVSTTFYSDSIVGNTVTVPLITAGTGSVFNGTYRDVGTAITNVDVPLNHVEYTFEISVTDANKNSAASLTSLYDSALKAFGASVAKYALSDVSSLTVSSSVANPAALDFQKVKDIAAQLDGVNAPFEDRSFIVRGDYFGSLRPSPTATIKLTPQDYGFNVVSPIGINVLPSGVKGVALAKGAYGVGSALTNNPLVGTSGVIDSTTLTDDKTGISFRYIVWADAASGKIKGTLETRVGGKAGIPGGSVKLV